MGLVYCSPAWPTDYTVGALFDRPFSHPRPPFFSNGLITPRSKNFQKTLNHPFSHEICALYTGMSYLNWYLLPDNVFGHPYQSLPSTTYYSAIIMIVIEPTGGLCNRMRAVDSAMALAVHLNRSLHVVWVMNDKLNCRFDDLFSVPSGIRISHMKSSGRISRNLLRVRRAYYRFSGLYINQKSLEELIQTKPGFSSFSKYRTVFILGHIGFFPNKYPFNRG